MKSESERAMDILPSGILASAAVTERPTSAGSTQDRETRAEIAGENPLDDQARSCCPLRGCSLRTSQSRDRIAPPPEQWGGFCPSTPSRASMLDRLLHHAVVVLTEVSRSG